MSRIPLCWVDLSILHRQVFTQGQNRKIDIIFYLDVDRNFFDDLDGYFSNDFFYTLFGLDNRDFLHLYSFNNLLHRNCVSQNQCQKNTSRLFAESPINHFLSCHIALHSETVKVASHIASLRSPCSSCDLVYYGPNNTFLDYLHDAFNRALHWDIFKHLNHLLFEGPESNYSL